MNLGSIIGLGSVCQPFPAGLTTLSGGHQWRSIDPWIQQSRSMDPSVSGSKCPELAPSSLLSLIRSWGAPQAMGVSWKRPLSTYASQRYSVYRTLQCLRCFCIHVLGSDHQEFVALRIVFPYFYTPTDFNSCSVSRLIAPGHLEEPTQLDTVKRGRSGHQSFS